MTRKKHDPQRKLLEPKMIAEALKTFQSLGIEPKLVKKGVMMVFEHKGSDIQFFPYTGWYSGKSVRDGRGINNLVRILKRDLGIQDPQPQKIFDDEVMGQLKQYLLNSVELVNELAIWSEKHNDRAKMVARIFGSGNGANSELAVLEDKARRLKTVFQDIDLKKIM